MCIYRDIYMTLFIFPCIAIFCYDIYILDLVFNMTSMNTIKHAL